MDYKPAKSRLLKTEDFIIVNKRKKFLYICECGNEKYIDLCGSYNAMLSYSNFLKLNGVVFDKNPIKKKNIYHFRFSGKNAVIVSSSLYHNSKIYLERKYKKYVEIML